MHKKSVKLITSAILLELGLAPLQAATITVDNNTCVLADAITAANTDTATNGCDAGSGADEIVLPQGSTVTLMTALPVVNTEVTLQGNDSVIERDSLAAENFGILGVDNGDPVASLTVNDSTLSGAVVTNNGGAVFCNGSANTLALNNSTITNNTGSGVVSYNCFLNINDSVISNNDSFDAPYYGGGVNVVSGYFIINNTSIIGNNNQASSVGGGGVYLADYGGIIAGSITNTTISGNTSELSGGGIGFFNFGYGATFGITNSTISDNQTTNGDGGGVFLYAPNVVGLSNNTIAGNTAYASGGGIAIRDNANVNLARNIVTGNVVGSGGTSVDFAGGGTVTVDQFNIFGENSTAGLYGITGGLTDIIPTVGTNAIIEPLADNGGPTQTHALPIGSPAIDAVALGVMCGTTDQRGETRPVDGNSDGQAECDIGSFEAVDVDLIFQNSFD